MVGNCVICNREFTSRNKGVVSCSRKCSTTLSWRNRSDKASTSDRITELEEVRFWERVKSSRDGCWLWIGRRDANGYGRIKVRQVLTWAHRISWWIHAGVPANAMCVCHKCDNPQCVRPDHLFLGTHRDNALDCVAKGRHASVVIARRRKGVA